MMVLSIYTVFNLAAAFGVYVHGLPTSVLLADNLAKGNVSVNTILDKAIESVGGELALASVRGITYHAPNLYRSQTLTQSYNLEHSDQSVATAGSQTMSFDFSNACLRRRIDRTYSYGDYWIWAFPNLTPHMNYTVISQTGSDGFASFTRGQNSFFSDDPTAPLGYVDGILADFLTHQSVQFAFPILLQMWKHNTAEIYFEVVKDEVSGLSFPALTNPAFELTLVLNETTLLPRIIRTYENNAIFGNSTSDLLLSNYQSVKADDNTTMLLPHRFQTIYNSRDVLEDVLVESIDLNPEFPVGFFTPNTNSSTPQAEPQRQPAYDRGEVHEFFEAGLWSGPFDFNTSSVISQQPIPGLEKVRSVWVGYADYAQLMVEFDDGILITDAPPHRSKILIQWAKENLGKDIKYVAPSHHHHDHAYGVGDYLAAGAALVIPQVARDYYASVNGGNFTVITFNETHPFIMKDETVQFRALYHEEAPHAKDWTYSIATSACPGPNDGVIVFNADVWSPGSDGLRFDTGYARQWLDDAVTDGLPIQSTILGAHGSTTDGTLEQMQSLIDILGYAYPNLNTMDWKAGGALCLKE